MADDDYADLTGGNDEDEEEKVFDYAKEHTVFLIDMSQDMHDPIIPHEDGAIPSMKVVLSSVVDFMKAKVEMGSQDEFAVVFYFTKSVKNNNAFAGVHVYMDLRVPTATDIRHIKDFVEDPSKLQDEVGTYQAVAGGEPLTSWAALRDGLWTAQICLNKKAKSVNVVSRLIIFSNSDDPTRGSRDGRRQIRTRVDMLREQQRASAQFLPLCAAVRPFNMEPFWRELLGQLRDEEDDSVGESGSQGVPFGDVMAVGAAAEDVQERLKALGESMRRRMNRRRPLASIRVKITPEVEIACQVFTLVMEAARPSAVRLHAQTNEELQSETRLISKDTATMLVGAPKTKSYTVTTKPEDRQPQVVFTTDEVSEIKKIAPPGIVVLGFKPLTKLAEYHQAGHATFMRPHERAIKGSTQTFAALHAAMLKTERFALATYVRNRNSMPKLVALLAQKHEEDEFGQLVHPEGIHIIPLPWANDIRQPETDPSVVGTQMATAEPELVELGCKIARATNVQGYVLGGMRNPYLVRHFEVLEALALKEDPPGQLEHDDTLGAPEAQAALEKRMGKHGPAFREMAQASAATQGSGTPAKKGTKRKADAVEEGGPALSISQQYAQINWRDLRGSNGLQKCTIDVLKIYLVYHKLKSSGKKAELVERVVQHMDSGV